MTCNYIKKRLFVSHANVGSTKILHSIKVWYDIWGKKHFNRKKGNYVQ